MPSDAKLQRRHLLEPGRIEKIHAGVAQRHDAVEQLGRAARRQRIAGHAPQPFRTVERGHDLPGLELGDARFIVEVALVVDGRADAHAGDLVGNVHVEVEAPEHGICRGQHRLELLVQLGEIAAQRHVVLADDGGPAHLDDLLPAADVAQRAGHRIGRVDQVLGDQIARDQLGAIELLAVDRRHAHDLDAGAAL